MKINLFSKLQIKVTRLMPLLLVSLSLLLQACTAPGVKDEPGLIAFLMEESFLVGHIYLMKADGSTPYPLNTGLKEDGCPVWSADGSKLLFISDNDPTEVYSANQNLYIVDINNGNLTRISNNELIYSTASFSPDGKQIVFSATSDSTKYHFQNIYLMNIDGSDIVKITDAPPIFFYPVWSPIENYILVIANYIDVDSSLYNILLLNPDGEVEATLVNNTDPPKYYPYMIANYSKPSWSPNGKWIAYSIQEGPNPGDIYKMKSDGTKKTKLTQAKGREINRSSSWSPSGNFIVFESNKAQYNNPFIYDMYAMDSNGNNETRLTNSPGYQMCPAWQPLP